MKNKILNQLQRAVYHLWTNLIRESAMTITKKNKLLEQDISEIPLIRKNIISYLLLNSRRDNLSKKYYESLSLASLIDNFEILIYRSGLVNGRDEESRMQTKFRSFQ